METTNEEKRPALYKYVNIPAGERFNPDRPSFETACGGSRTQGSVLNYLVSKACYIAELQKLQSYKVISISVDRAEVLKTLRISEQTYIACLKALNAFKYIDSKRYTRGEYDIHLETINEGIEHPPEQKRRGRPKGSTKKSESNKSAENAFTLEESPLTYAQELEEEVKALTGELKELELKVISILTFQQVLELKLKELELSHSHEPTPEAERWAFFTPLDYLDSNEITIEEESMGEQNEKDTLASPHVDAALPDFPLITYADCITYLKLRGVSPQGDAVQVMVQARTLYVSDHSETHSQQGDTDASLPLGRSDRAGTSPAPAMGASLPPRQDLQPLPSTPGPILQAESAPEIDEEWCNAETEHRLPAIPRQTPSLSPAVEPGRSGGPTPVAPATLPGLTSHEQNRDAFPPGSVAVETDSGCTTPAPAPQVPPGVTPPRTMRAMVVPAPPKWDAQAMVARAEALRDKPFSESARPKETKAARKLFARKSDLTEEEFTSAFQHWNTPWWHETNGPFCITDLAAVPKNKSEMRLIIALEKLAMPKKPPGGQVIQMPTTRGQQWRSSFDDPDYDMSAEFYPGTVAR